MILLLACEFGGMFAGEGEPVLTGLGIAAAHQLHGLLEHLRHSMSLPPRSRPGPGRLAPSRNDFAGRWGERGAETAVAWLRSPA